MLGHRHVHLICGKVGVVSDLESRVAALEDQVSQLRDRVQASEQDAAAARVLAGAADRDVSAIQGELRDFRRATAASFNALREDFMDLRDHVDRGFARIDVGFTEIRGTLDAAATGQERLANLIQALIDRS